MPADLERMLGETEDFLRRQLGSRAAREAGKRRLKRGAGEALRRVRRAALLVVVLLAALIFWSIAISSVGFLTWLIALPTILLAALISLTFPTRQFRRGRGEEGAGPDEPRLDRLAERAEDWLIDQAGVMPRAALPAFEEILVRLDDLRPGLADLSAADPLAGEARRLIGSHLPLLVDSYAALPPEKRRPDSESSRRIAESLDLVAEEMTRLCDRIDGCRVSAFETQTRFIETRYRDADRLRGD